MKIKDIAGSMMTSVFMLLIAEASCAEPEGSVEVGLGYLGDDAWQYGNHGALNDQGSRLFVNFDLLQRPEADSGETVYWRVEGSRLGLDMPRLFLEVGEQGTRRLQIDFREIPRYRFDEAMTPLQGVGSSVLTLPDNWQVTEASTQGMLTLDESLQEVNLWHKRRTLNLDYLRRLGDAWRLEADFRRDTVRGTRALGGATGATGGNVRALLLPAPLDYETHIASVTLGFTGSRLRWHLGYQGSFFSNGADRLTWQTPFAAHPQWGEGVGYPEGHNRMALEPDNEAHQLRIGGSYAFAGTTRMHADVVLSRHLQDQDFLPYTINPGLEVNEALPMSSLEGRVDETRVNLRLSSRPLRRLNLTARVGFRERDNRTRIAEFQRVPGDAANQQSALDARLNRPYGLEKTTASVDGSWRLGRRLRLETGLEYSDTERDYSEVRSAEEQGLRVGLRSTRFATLALALDYRHLQRRTDDYVGNHPLVTTHVPGTIGVEDFENHPLLRKYYLSERDRDQLRVQGDWYPADALSIGMAIAWNEDDYPDEFFGLNRSTMLSGTVDVTYAPTEGLRFTGFYTRDRYRNDQSGRSFRGSVPADAFDPDRNWQVEATDRFDTVGLTLEREQLPLRVGDWQPGGTLDLELQLSHSRSSGEIDTAAGPALTEAPLPDLETRLNTLSLTARYHWSERSSLWLELAREHYRSRDFALDDVAPDAQSNVLVFGQQSPRYRATWLSLGYQYRY